MVGRRVPEHSFCLGCGTVPPEVDTQANTVLVAQVERMCGEKESSSFPDVEESVV